MRRALLTLAAALLSLGVLLAVLTLAAAAGLAWGLR